MMHLLLGWWLQPGALSKGKALGAATTSLLKRAGNKDAQGAPASGFRLSLLHATGPELSLGRADTVCDSQFDSHRNRYITRERRKSCEVHGASEKKAGTTPDGMMTRRVENHPK